MVAGPHGGSRPVGSSQPPQQQNNYGTGRFLKTIPNIYSENPLNNFSKI
uniref:Uncharacterized protein n=1 Tax=Meloidogyne enterolobii TaxID=390850 RepID=A0A6V7VB15_MELEN|nr:unnamed protein product [Meloidogyne enterolobii]